MAETTNQKGDTFEEVMQKSTFSLQDWHIIYNAKSSGRDYLTPSPWLEKYAATLLPDEPCSVFVPLCGMTPDLRWFYDRGNTVVGLEGVIIPVHNFFKLQKLEYEEHPMSNGGTVVQTKDKRLKIFVCDVMKATKEDLGDFNLVYDYGAYTAIFPQDRQGYVSLILSVLKKDFKLFVEFCHGAPENACGLPTSIPLSTLKTEWGSNLNYEFLETSDIAEEWDVESFFDSFVLLTSNDHSKKSLPTEAEHEEHIQCNHEAGIGVGHHRDPILEDLFKKDDFTLDDWATVYDHAPEHISKGSVSPCLAKYAETILPKQPARVLLPLCGKTFDLRWFYDMGNTVVGIEGIEKPVVEFFTAHDDLKFIKSVKPCGMKVYQTDDERLTIYVCDIFKLSEEILGNFDFIYDYGAYSAIQADSRKRYASLLMQLMKIDASIFLEVCHDAPFGTKEIPGNISLQEVKLHWDNTKSMKFLQTTDISEAWKLPHYFSSYILLTMKAK